MKRTCVYLIIFASALLGAISCSKDKDEEISPTKSSEKELITFTFLAATNEALSGDVTATIDQTAKTVSARLPFGTAINELEPTVTVSPKAAISPTGIRDFSSDVIYTVTAEDGSETDYTVEVTVVASSEKEMTSFTFLAASNTELNEDVIATIDQEAKTVSATVPFGTDLTALVPTIEITPGAQIDPIGGTTDFSSPVTYTITARDGSKATYSVSVTQQQPLADRQILVHLFKSNPENNIDESWDVENPDSDISTWKGVTLDANGRVVELSFYDEDDIFSSANLTVIPASIGNLTQLTELNLYRNNLTTIPAEIGNLTALKELNLSLNKLETIPAEIGNLSQLTHLFSTHNQLETIPGEIGKLTALRGLYLTANQLETIPAEIGNLSQLTSLNLTKNQLKTIPAEIGNLSQLTSLVLYLNQLETIPAEIGNLSQLTSLKLTENQLKTIPAEIGNLSQLTQLYLNSNQLETIPAEIGNLIALKELFLTSNQLETIPQAVCDLANTGTHLTKDSGASCGE